MLGIAAYMCVHMRELEEGYQEWSKLDFNAGFLIAALETNLQQTSYSLISKAYYAVGDTMMYMHNCLKSDRTMYNHVYSDNGDFVN